MTTQAEIAVTTYFVFYDGHCQFCTDSARTLRQMDAENKLQFVNVQSPAELARFPQIDPVAALGQMHVIAPDGTLSGGFDALLALMPVFPSLRMFQPLFSGPLMRQLGNKLYRWVAANRYRIAGTTGCAGGSCKLPT